VALLIQGYCEVAAARMSGFSKVAATI